MTKQTEAMKLALEADIEWDLIDKDEGQVWYITQAGLARFAELVRADERMAMMQLFTDPENQPTQHGTVTLEYMQREIADERNSWPAEMEAMERQVNILTDALAKAKEKT